MHSSLNVVSEKVSQPIGLACPVDLLSYKTACNDCRVRALCLPTGLSRQGNDRFSELISQRIRINKGGGLYQASDPLEFLYAVRFGSFKTCFTNVEGQGLVTNFWMPGDIMGCDAISTNRHVCCAFALEDSEVCLIPYKRLETLAHEFPFLQQSLNRLLSSEIVRDHKRLLMMCNFSAEERLASFLLGLSKRYAERGFSAHGFVLRMSRDDIASYLGLRLETICRSIAHLRQLEIVTFGGRTVEILNMPALKALEHGYGHHCAASM
ncbi:helix-turn-helix domain-containing protein [Pseudomonas sp. BBP2017]|uniref:helix-turn-helix domain-containing protein n=1 Tax=Pseudomonas sp. BBP2017 TaxID=2109731 RepID=UPI000D11A9DD|nr:helix-turn-helix domain-containing protein [Pseudomonas sp. BBP2017]PSS58710.1 Crp/Fnr family transcriptional regulator [Pseudomonas sp. BBP2017]